MRRTGSWHRMTTYDKAAARHAADRVTFDHAAELAGADVVILCQDPAGIIGFLQEHRDRFKPGCLIWDVCGVKTAVMEAAQCLPSGVDFIGCHPMAGKEVSGIDNAEGTLFRNTHFIITPGPRATAEHLGLLRRMAGYCRFGDVIETTPERHDEMIAYTSQMAHVVSNAFVKSPRAQSHKGYSAGSYKDLTRVAWLNEDMWTTLFLENRDFLLEEIRLMQKHLEEYAQAMEHNDPDRLRALLAEGRLCKEKVDAV